MTLQMKLIIVGLLIVLATSATKDQWKTRTIYQVLTDRFARGNGDQSICYNINTYCGGNFDGLIKNLQYIKGMGFDAIWISPVVANYPGGYHGYWASDFYGINSQFGSSDDLKRLVSTCHSMGIYVMVDVVANHVGTTNEDYSAVNPFNSRDHYHDYCIINNYDFATHNMHNIQYCRLAGLADLNTENAWVRSQLMQWIKWLVSTYNFDGIRIDTIPHIPVDFWKEFSNASGVYTVGEAFDGSADYIAQFLSGLDGVLNYPFFYTMRDAFMNGQSMFNIRGYLNYWITQIGENNVGYLGNFIDNHDNARTLANSVSGNRAFDDKLKLYQGMLAMTLTSLGIPIIYYGSEQNYGGENDPYCREILWTNFNTNSDMYKFITTINWAQNQVNALGNPHVERYVDDEVYAFTRGELFVAVTNNISGKLTKQITYHGFSENRVLCNIFFNTDCVTIRSGSFDLYLNYGEVKMFIPKEQF